MALFEHAYCPHFEDKLEFLAALAASERWAFPGDTGRPILWNYVHHTFNRLLDEDSQSAGRSLKIICNQDQQQSCFNTGLFTLVFSQRTMSPYSGCLR